MTSVEFAPSILSADFGKLRQEIATVEGVADAIHVDVMDGHFVPNITIGPIVSNSLKCSGDIDLPFGIHLMITDPGKYGPEFSVDPDDTIIFHSEVTDQPERLIELLREQGCGVGISQKPASPVENILPLLPQLEEILVMGVEPGFGGQEFNPDALVRIRKLREKIDAEGLDTVIAVDGGMNPNTVGQVVAAGADKIVAGSAVFGKADRIEAIKEMKEAID